MLVKCLHCGKQVSAWWVWKYGTGGKGDVWVLHVDPCCPYVEINTDTLTERRGKP